MWRNEVVIVSRTDAAEDNEVSRTRVTTVCGELIAGRAYNGGYEVKSWTSLDESVQMKSLTILEQSGPQCSCRWL